MPDWPGQKYSCHGCGTCCRDFTVELRAADMDKLEQQGWRERLGGEFAVEFGGKKWLKQKPDGACVFLGENGLCRVHAEFGLEAKPLACQFFPFMLSPDGRNTVVGLSFACGSVAASKGASLDSHRAEVKRMAELLPASAPIPVLLTGGIIATEAEVGAVQAALDEWLAKKTTTPALRWEGFAWLVTSVMRANLSRMRGEKLRELMHTLVGAAEEELPLLDWPAPQPRAWKLLRQAVFFRVEDPKIGELLKRGRMMTALGQWSRSRAWAGGKGVCPEFASDAPVEFKAFDATHGLFQGSDAAAMDDLLQRWIRASLLGGRAWGSGLYRLPIDQGLGLILVNLLCAMWLARFRAAGRGERTAALADLVFAIGRVDRASGRAPWLATAGERLRASWLAHSDSLRLLSRALASNG